MWPAIWTMLAALSVLVAATDDNSSINNNNNEHVAPAILKPALDEVALACPWDVEVFCDSASFVRLMDDATIFVPDVPGPERALTAGPDALADFGAFFGLLSSVMDATTAGGSFTVVVLDNANETPPAETAQGEQSNEDAVVNELISRFIADANLLSFVQDDDPFEHLSQSLTLHGATLLERPDATVEQVRIARRLMEVTPEQIQKQSQEQDTIPRLFRYLPFGCPGRNHCLWQAYKRRQVSLACGSALQRFENQFGMVEKAEQEHREQFRQLQRQKETFICMCMFAYALVLVGLIISVWSQKNRSMQAEDYQRYERYRYLVIACLILTSVMVCTMSLTWPFVLACFGSCLFHFHHSSTGDVGGCCDNCCCCGDKAKTGQLECCGDCCCCGDNAKTGELKCCGDCCCCASGNKKTMTVEVYEAIPLVQIV